MTQEEHGISSIYDLISADNAKLFDTDGDGKGELYIGPSGWISTNVEKVRGARLWLRPRSSSFK